MSNIHDEDILPPDQEEVLHWLGELDGGKLRRMDTFDEAVINVLKELVQNHFLTRGNDI